MKIFRSSDSAFAPADARSFVGAARSRRLAVDERATPVRVYHVEFEAGARTNWHVHSGVQWLFIVEGRVRVQAWGGPAKEVSAGDAIVFGPGEKHWHGAAPGSRGAHMAVNVDSTTEWLEAVTDEEYSRAW